MISFRNDLLFEDCKEGFQENFRDRKVRKNVSHNQCTGKFGNRNMDKSSFEKHAIFLPQG